MKLQSFLAIVLLTALLPASKAGIKIEQAQRAFQGRYWFLTSNYVMWPDCTCGTAPNFPMDGFYGDISKNPVWKLFPSSGRCARRLLFECAQNETPVQGGGTTMLVKGGT